MTTTAAPEPLRVCGIVLREERSIGLFRYHGSDGRVRVLILPCLGHPDGYEGFVRLDRHWSVDGRPEPAREPVTLAHAYGLTPENCAHTLTEMVESVRAALVALPGGGS